MQIYPLSETQQQQESHCIRSSLLAQPLVGFTLTDLAISLVCSSYLSPTMTMMDPSHIVFERLPMYDERTFMRGLLKEGGMDPMKTFQLRDHSPPAKSTDFVLECMFRFVHSFLCRLSVQSLMARV